MARSSKRRRVANKGRLLTPSGPMRDDEDARLLKRSIVYTHELIEHYISLLTSMGRDPRNCPVLGACATRTDQAKPALFDPSAAALSEAQSVMHEANRVVLQMATLIECQTTSRAATVPLFRWAENYSSKISDALVERAKAIN